MSYLLSPPSPPTSKEGHSSHDAKETTPMEIDASSEEDENIATLDGIYSSKGHSPLKGSLDLDVKNHVETTANEILRHIPRQQPGTIEHWSWNDLSGEQKVFFAFLIVKEQHLIMKEYSISNQDRAMMMFRAATDESSMEYKTLYSFLRKGGDDHKPVEERLPSEVAVLQKFLKDVNWPQDDDEHSYTIFNTSLAPLLRYQTESSKVCFVVSAVNMIYYYMCIQNPRTPQVDAITSYAINVGRLMRNHFDNDQIYKIIFYQEGGYPTKILEKLLVQPKDVWVETTNNIKLGFPDKPLSRRKNISLYFDIKEILKDSGPLLVERFVVFDKFLDASIKKFDDPEVMAGTKKPYSLHAFLIVGVRLVTTDMCEAKVEFLIQDSYAKRPFVVIGLDLLHSMQAVIGLCIDPIYIMSSAYLNMSNFEHTLLETTNFRTITSGSPRNMVPNEVVLNDPGELSVPESLTSGDEDDDSKRKKDVDTKPDWLGFDTKHMKDGEGFGVIYT